MSITSSTKITFPGGAISGASKILFTKKISPDAPTILVITESTPFHPLDHSWQDQPSDKGTISINGKTIPVQQCLTAALNNQTEEFLLDQEIKNRKIRRDDPNWFFLVAHLIEDPNLDLVGQEAKLAVDVDYRMALSKTHTASHFTALALNKVTANLWKKPQEQLDALGNPNLDREAIAASTIGTDTSIDQYHCGKSLRKKGFDSAQFFSADTLKQIETKINQQLHDWLSSGKLNISMSPPETYLNEKREWTCVFPDGKKAVIPCGGTHYLKISPQDKIIITLEKNNESDFTIISRFIS